MTDLRLRPELEPLSQETFDRFRALIYTHTHIHMRESKHILVSNRLRKRVLALGLSSYEEYYRYLTEGKERQVELPNFIDAVSTNETYFYRETGHFNALTERILPELFRRRRTLRIWSAGCSSGEEPYTLAIILEEGRGRLWEGQAEILATDISREMITAAREGSYRERSLRFVPAGLHERYFQPAGVGTWRVAPALKQRISFGVHNLLEGAPEPGPFDLIFCRNVMIYFDKPTQRQLVDEVFASVLDPSGYLCIGHSESLTGTSERFHYLRGFKAPVYQLR